MNPITLIAAMLLSVYLRQSKFPLFSSGTDQEATLEIRSMNLDNNQTVVKYEKEEFCVDIHIEANPAPTSYALTKDQTPVSQDAYSAEYTAVKPPLGDLTLRIPELARGMSGQYSFTIENGIGTGVEFSFTLFVQRAIFQFRIPETEVPTFKNGSGTVPKIVVPIQAEPAPTSHRLIRDGDVQDEDAYNIDYVSENPPDGTYTLTSLAFGHFELVISNRLGDELRYKFEVVQKAPCYFSPTFYVGDEQKSDEFDYLFDENVPEVTIFCTFVDVCQEESLLLKCPASQIEMTKEGRVIVALTLTPAMHETRCSCTSNKPEVQDEAILNLIFRSDLRIVPDRDNGDYRKHETADLELTIGVYGNPSPTIYVLTMDTIRQPDDTFVANYAEVEFPNGQVTFRLLNISLDMTGLYKLTMENSVGSQIDYDFNLFVSPVILRLQPGVPESQEIRNRSGSIPTIDVPLEVDPRPSSYQLFKDGSTEVTDTTAIVVIHEKTLGETVKLSSLDFGKYVLVVKNELGKELCYSFEVVDKDPCYFNTVMSFDQQEMSQGHAWVFDSEQTVMVKCSFVEAELCQVEQITLQCPAEDLSLTGSKNVHVSKTFVPQMHEKTCVCKSVKSGATNGAIVTFDFKAGIRAPWLKNNEILTGYANGGFDVDIGVFGNPPPTTYTLHVGEDATPLHAYTANYTAYSFPEGTVALHIPDLTLDMAGEYTFTIKNGIGDGVVLEFQLVVKEATLVPRYEATEIRDYRNRLGVHLTIDVPVQADPVPTIYRLVKNGSQEIQVNSHQVSHTKEGELNMTLHLTTKETLKPDLYELEIENSVGDVITYTFAVSDRDPCFYSSVISIGEEGPSKKITWTYSNMTSHKVYCRFQDVCRTEVISLKCLELKTGKESVTLIVATGLSMHQTQCTCKSIRPRTGTAEITFIYETAVVLKDFENNKKIILFEGCSLSMNVGVYGNPIPNRYALTKENITVTDFRYIVTFKPGQFPNGVVVFTIINLSVNYTGQYTLYIGNGRGPDVQCNFNLVVKEVILQLKSQASVSVKFKRAKAIKVSILAAPPPFSYSLFKDNILEEEGAYTVQYAPGNMTKGTVILTAVDMFEYGSYEFVIKNNIGDEIVYRFMIDGTAFMSTQEGTPLRNIVFFTSPVVLIFVVLLLFMWKMQCQEPMESAFDSSNGTLASSSYGSSDSSIRSESGSAISGEVQTTSVDHLPCIPESVKRDSVFSKDPCVPSIYEVESYPDEIQSISSD